MRDVKKLIKESWSAIFLAGLLMFAGAWLGYQYSHVFDKHIAAMMDQLKDIVEHIEGKDSPLYTAWYIFQNNTKAAMMMVILGIFFFFAPGFTLFANGLVIGYVLHTSANAGVAPLAVILYGLMPHGILELPVIIVAGGLGMFLGWRLLRWFWGSEGFFAHAFGEKRNVGVRTLWEERGKQIFKERLHSVSALLIIMICTLFVAAMIESFVTPLIIEKMIRS
ncbi:stage II sporulation protein M [Caldalkalibacillus mannanilyticus]|uniref:stage II sporulation protein M n=1 Tax=Caldalkalibacillus mannanilyticus TaxID=1418 RepID=UPI00046AFC08|nr:stage II sporulation protein M [Caldalkalibacillus mannanilyticus]